MCILDIVVYDSKNVATRLSATTTVTVTILDVNDNAPVFVGAPYNVTISRDLTPGHVIFDESTIVATDADEGLNGRVKYTLTGGKI